MTFEYTVKQSRRKTLALNIKPDCSIEVRAPLTLSQKAIEKFVASHSDWIQKNIEKTREINKMKQSFRLDYGTEACFFGKRVAVIQSDIKKAKLTENGILMPSGLDSEQIREKLIKLYKETARKYIDSRIPFFSQHVGVNPSKTTISSAKTNWGSCTADRVHFSWHLVMAPAEVIDYVIIHELVHIIHHNHSENFWSKVAQHCPNYKELRFKLKEYSEILANENWY